MWMRVWRMCTVFRLVLTLEWEGVERKEEEVEDGRDRYSFMDQIRTG
jgi:hypothetical protein